MIIRLRLWVIVFLLGGVLPLSITQTFTEQKNTYPLSVNGSKYIANGFIPFSPMNDEGIYANALLWTTKNVYSTQRDGTTEIGIPAKSFSCGLVLTSRTGTKQKSTYYCTTQFQTKDGELVHYLSNIQIESSVIMVKKVTPMEKPQPEKKPSHQGTMGDLVQIELQILNKLFDFVSTGQLSPIAHWNEINIGKPVKGMIEDEYLLASGKPQTISRSDGEVQWMYSNSSYLFFKNRYVEMIMK